MVQRYSACADYSKQRVIFVDLNLTEMRHIRINKIILGKVGKSPFEKLRVKENKQLLEWEKYLDLKSDEMGKESPIQKPKYQSTKHIPVHKGKKARAQMLIWHP